MRDQVATERIMNVGIKGGHSAFEEIFMRRPELSWPLMDGEVLDRHRKAKIYYR